MNKEASNVLVFGGQGEHKVGMGYKLHRESPQARQTFEESSDTLCINVAKLCFEDPKDQLNQSPFAQPAIVTYQIAKQRHLTIEEDVQIDLITAQSLGQISAAITAESITFADGLRLANIRGKAMREADKGAMSAIVYLPIPEVYEICKEVEDNAESLGLGKYKVVEVASENSEFQAVISGHIPAIEAAERLTTERGAKVKRLEVNGTPSHSSLMVMAREKLKAFLQNVQVSTPLAAIPLVSNVTARYLTSAEEVKRTLADQVATTIKFLDAVKLIIQNGGKVFHEAGPGIASTKLIKRIDPSVEITIYDY